MPAVNALLRRMGAEAALADDLTQDAMIAALAGLHSYRGDAPFASWTMTVAARLYLKRRRKDARTVIMVSPLGQDEGGPNPELSSRTRLDLDRALATLSPPERLCVTLCHGAGMTHDEIAASLAAPLGTVKSHVLRGMKKLKALMVSEGSEE